MKKSHQAVAILGFSMLVILKIVKKVLVLALTLAVLLLPFWFGLALSCDFDDNIEYKNLKNTMQSDVVYVGDEFFEENGLEIPTLVRLDYDETKTDETNSGSGYNGNVFAYSYVTANHYKADDWNIEISIKCDKRTEEYRYIAFDTGETIGVFSYKEEDYIYYIDCGICVMSVRFYIYSQDREDDYDYESQINDLCQALIVSLINNIEYYEQAE